MEEVTGSYVLIPRNMLRAWLILCICFVFIEEITENDIQDPVLSHFTMTVYLLIYMMVLV